MLLNLLDVPGNNDEHQADKRVLGAEIAADSTIILPLTTIIETGNAITRDARASIRAGAFVKVLRLALAGKAPWAASGVGLTPDLLTSMLNGHRVAGDLLSLMTSRVGTGDACILAEVAAYRARIPSETPVRIWSHDVQLAAYS